MFYAFVHKYGVHTRDTQRKRIGHVAVFPTRRTRDDFVSEFGNAEAINSKTARVCLVDELLAERPYMYDETPYLSMAEIAHEVVAMRCDNR